MLEFHKPKIECVEQSEDRSYAKVVMEPLDKGFGITLGNSLRRVLLSSLPGVAVTKVKIDGALHEFSTVEGVREDITNIILNSKALRAKMCCAEPKTMILDVKGPDVYKRQPQWTKGGVVFAPKPRSYAMKVNKKVRKLAMLSALSMKVTDDEMLVLDTLTLSAPKTKEMVKILDNLNVRGKALIITAEKDEEVARAARNIPGVKTTVSGAISVYDIVNCDKLIVTDVYKRQPLPRLHSAPRPDRERAGIGPERPYPQGSGAYRRPGRWKPAPRARR